MEDLYGCCCLNIEKGVNKDIFKSEAAYTKGYYFMHLPF